MHKFLLCYLLLSGLVYPLKAQILNIEKNLLEIDTATHYWTGAAELAFTLNNRSATPENPTKFISLRTDADLAYISGRHRYMLINKLEYRSLSGDPFIRTGFSHFRTSFTWREKLGAEIFAQMQFDIGRGLTNRSLAGAGLRINLFRAENFSLTIGPGLMYERERWKVPGSEPTAYEIRRMLKSTNYISSRWRLSKVSNFRIISYFQTGYDTIDEVFRHRASFDASLGFRITRRLFFVTNFVATYENRPIVPIQPWVYQLENGLRYTF